MLSSMATTTGHSGTENDSTDELQDSKSASLK